MEQARQWMWTNRNHGLISASYDDSWEEQAFAEDATGPHGGCIWPPRSYSCSFCRREFRSAQALGGHMNVHRRDRARLKQSPSDPHNEILNHEHHQAHNHAHQNPFTSLAFQYPTQVCTLVYNPNPNSVPGFLASPSSPCRVSAASTKDNGHEKTLFPHLSSSTFQDHHENSQISSPTSGPNVVGDTYCNISDSKTEGEKSPSRIVESGCKAKVDHLKTDLSVSLNLVVCRTRPTLSSDEEAIGCKRRKTDQPSSIPLFLKPSAIDHRHHVQSEDLDLELRLGERPKVK